MVIEIKVSSVDHLPFQLGIVEVVTDPDNHSSPVKLSEAFRCKRALLCIECSTSGAIPVIAKVVPSFPDLLNKIEHILILLEIVRRRNITAVFSTFADLGGVSQNIGIFSSRLPKILYRHFYPKPNPKILGCLNYSFHGLLFLGLNFGLKNLDLIKLLELKNFELKKFLG